MSGTGKRQSVEGAEHQINDMKNIISFDCMKLQKDVIGSMPSQTLVHNLMSLVKNNFPGVTHIALSVPINTTDEFKAHGTTPAPLTVEDFTTMWIDEIHNMGYNVI